MAGDDRVFAASRQTWDQSSSHASEVKVGFVPEHVRVSYRRCSRGVRGEKKRIGSPERLVEHAVQSVTGSRQAVHGKTGSAEC